ncbi:MAG TPA: lactonase family protein [Bryobacteraceae bacterium]|nr:lactonase family protein [Bryobacteraceae bacterium]
MIRSILLLTLSFAPAALAAVQYFAYVGTYTRGASKGIYSFRFDPSTGGMSAPALAAEVSNPSFLAVHPNRKYLYAVSELGNDGKSNGAVTAYGIDARTGALTRLNSVSSGGGGACHLVVDKTGKSLAVANYGSGSVAVFPVSPDGKLGEASSVIQHKGSSVDQRRQRGPHAHAVVLSGDNRFLFAPDLGLDEVLTYRLDPAKASLTANDPPFAKVAPGSGPRHFAFHPKGRYAYVLNEMASKVTAFDYDASRGALKEIQTVSTLPPGFTGEDNSAEVEVDAKGRFLYASNRGHDSIAVFAIGKDGKLTLVENMPTAGKTPRNFKLDPSGAWLLAANQESDTIVQFRVDPKTGKLSPTGKKIEVAKPVCVQFVPAAR